jgi:2-dehydro-3-deoxyglucarate aldolase
MLLVMHRQEHIQALRRRLAEGRSSLGCWLQIPSSDVAEIVAAAGFDWVAVDAEHGAIDVSQYPDLFRAIELSGALPLVRVAEAAEMACRRALDAGAGGVIVPRVESAAQAVALAAACRWPPNGTRGVGFSRANRYGTAFEEYKAEAAAPIFVAMIESGVGVKNVEEICAAGVVDALFVGPYDLSASIGSIGDLRSGEVIAALDQIRVAAARHGVPLGIHSVSTDPAELGNVLREGFQFVAYSTDALVLASALSAVVKSRIEDEGK